MTGQPTIEIMEKDIPLTIETLSGKDAEYLIVSEKEIEFVLRDMAEHGARVAVYYGGPGYLFLSTLLGVDHKGIWFEQSPDRVVNERIASSDDLIFVSAHMHAKVQFDAGHVSVAEYKKYPAFHLSLPKHVYRLQRRDFFRMPASISKPLRCRIAAKNASSPITEELTVMDISVGGVSLVCTESDIEIAAGDIYQDCQLDLPEMGTISGTLEVKNLATSNSPPGHTHKLAGCEFKNLDTRSANLLQRYVTNMQREKNNPS